MNEVKRILSSCSDGDPCAAEELLPLVYEELRSLARAKMANTAPGQTLQATALVHEAWLRLVGMDKPSWESRRHFFRTAALAMQHILIEVARRKKAVRHGGDQVKVSLDETEIAASAECEDFLVVQDALARLDEEDPEKAEIVRFRYFVGLDTGEISEMTGLSARTVERHWAYAKAWLGREIERQRRESAESAG